MLATDCNSTERLWRTNDKKARSALSWAGIFILFINYTGLRLAPCMQAQKEGARATVFLPTGEQYKGSWRDNKRHGMCRKCSMLNMFDVQLH
jgi:hypothetical protein